MKKAIPLIIIPLALLCVTLSPGAGALTPPPDGCYPNFTTAEGCDALSLLTTGAANTGLGWRSLFSDTIGSFNTSIGAGALVLSNADSNTAVGAAALLLNTAGTANTAVGTGALLYNDGGDRNTATGAFALYNKTTGNDNTAIGTQALFNNIGGAQNTAVGSAALFNNTNVNNTAVGLSALGQTTGQGNIGIGAFAGNNITTGDFNIHIFTPGTSNDHRTIRIGDGTQTATYVGGISGAMVPGGVTVIIDALGHLGTVVSSQRFKDEIKPMDNASETIFALKPVTFRYKKELDPDSISQFGLVAEEVEKVNPDLVVRDAKGEVYTVRYEAVNAMLLNEFLKEHRKVEELEATVAQQHRNFESKLAEQARQIEALRSDLQKVSARFEVRTATPQIAATNP